LEVTDANRNKATYDSPPDAGVQLGPS
jgi:hypothetical protein